ncbi:putative flavin-nucleotide-binding protein [Candidatus Methanoperedens nitroreducens]|uniref:Putative flavin-nucleotide-binding protein n=1 Tax=Candidatus Methanoperedens nitratireducens TaxID=1392998 RepID=A0A062VE23_9EURY|nr:pyridoxamine 5'-phosphate oxidase family protein [Candidatus Methanoperedens nitroreducens]KCZ73420.1 putative flavin-nucleotide-binding protein [Candidatus Methanoperedens nitroreducens]MDJ1422625.1 pyridoxamine 5'-phosphate oxidase family protein [Candidatus Methanoperedens sp.]
MEIVKIPKMEKEEYDRLISEQHISRIAFKGEEYPYIAPFLYVFDGNFMYFLSTKYGRKIKYFKQNPHVSIEIERYSRDLSNYSFVVLTGRLVEVKDATEKKTVREKFVRLIKDKNISKNIMVAIGHSPDDPIETITGEDNTNIWKLVDVREIIGLKSKT